jgi:hypothetical protein
LAAGVSVVVAGAGGVVTSLVTARPSAGLWVALGVLVVGGGVLQAVVMGRERGSGRVTASGAGSVAVGGSVGEVRTRVQGMSAGPAAPGGDGVTASGPGAVAVGGEVTGSVSAEVSEPAGREADG